MNIRVVKGSNATVKIPSLRMSVEPAIASIGYISNIEGVLRRFKKIVENQRDSAEEDSIKKSAKNLLKKIRKVEDGEQEIKGVKSFLRGLSFADIRLLLDRVDFWISADNFFQHFAHYYGKKGFVIFALSDPKIFGWEDNINLQVKGKRKGKSMARDWVRARDLMKEI